MGDLQNQYSATTSVSRVEKFLEQDLLLWKIVLLFLGIMDLIEPEYFLGVLVPLELWVELHLG